jgi:alpha-L-rhamnosidase
LFTQVPLSNTFSVHAFAPIRAIKTVTAVNVTRVASTGAYLFWFPANEAGVIELVNVSGPRGATITLSHGEILKDPSGNTCLVACDGKGDTVFYPFASTTSSVTTKSVGNSNDDNATAPSGGAVDRFTFAGGGEESYTFQFTYHGFQFMQIDGWTWSPGPTLEQVPLCSSPASTLAPLA